MTLSTCIGRKLMSLGGGWMTCPVMNVVTILPEEYGRSEHEKAAVLTEETREPGSEELVERTSDDGERE